MWTKQDSSQTLWYAAFRRAKTTQQPADETECADVPFPMKISRTKRSSRLRFKASNVLLCMTFLATCFTVVYIGTVGVANSRHKSNLNETFEDTNESDFVVIEPTTDGEDNERRKYHEPNLYHEVPLEFDNTFPWWDVDLSQMGKCGVDKCFWPSRTNSTIGYLLAAEGNYDGLRHAFPLAERLKRQCKIRHLYAEPAVLVNVTRRQMRQLDNLVDNPSRRKVNREFPNVFYIDDGCVVAQKVLVAPTPHLLYGTYGTKWDALWEDVPEYRDNLEVSVAELRHRLQSERHRIECALEHEPIYWVDFQGLIDEWGLFYHIDLDAHFWEEIVSLEEERRQINGLIQWLSC